MLWKDDGDWAKRSMRWIVSKIEESQGYLKSGGGEGDKSLG